MVTARRALYLLLLAAAISSGPAEAQSTAATGFALDRFDPAPPGSRWFALDSIDMGDRWGLAAGLVFDGAVRPLVIYRGDAYHASPVMHQDVLHLGASLTMLGRLRLALDLPLTVYAGGSTGDLNGVAIPQPDGAVAGDVRIDGDVRLLGEPGDRVRLAAGVAVFAPSGSRGAYTGDGKVRVEPRLVASGDFGRIAYAARVGFEYRDLSGELGGRSLGSEVRFGAAVGVRVLRQLLIGPELYGNAVVTGSGSAGPPPLEAILGVHFAFAAGFHAGLAGGAGLTRGLGSPQARMLFSLSWSPHRPRASWPGDRDGDGIPDDHDACPNQAGQPTHDPRTNGCPTPDVDDLPFDVQRRRCIELPNAPGCSNADRDGDGVPDDADACPDEPGPRTPDPMTNGCPVGKRP